MTDAGKKDRSEVKRWCYTHFNLEALPTPCIPDADCQYRIEGKEVCPTSGRDHIQGFVILVKACRWTAFKKLYPLISDFRKAKGNPFQNFTYCSKDGDFTEFGPRPKELKEGKSEKDLAFTAALEADTVSEGLQIIREKSPRDFCLYGQTIENNLKKAKAVPFVPRYKPEDFNISKLLLDQPTLLCGPSNIGKTQFAVSHFQNPLVVSHIDALKKLGPDHDGIVFDDMSFKHWPVESVIHLLDKEMDRMLNVRYGTVDIPSGTKKIFTHNSDNPFYNTEMISDEQREAVERRFLRLRVYRQLYNDKK